MITRHLMKLVPHNASRIVLTILLLLVCVSITEAQTTPPSPVIEFQRVYVPENRSQEWPRSGFEFAPQMKLSDFEQLVSQYTQQQNQQDQNSSAERIVYRAELAGRTLQGTAEFVLRDSEEDKARFVSLAGSNLFYFDQQERLEAMRSFWVGEAGKRRGVFLRESRSQFTVDWSYYVSMPSPDETRVNLELAFAPQVDFYLTLPQSYKIVLHEGIQLEPPSPDQSSTVPSQTWHFCPQWEGKLSLSLATSDRDFKLNEATVTQSTRYRVQNNACEVNSEISLHSPPLGPFDLTIPNDLVVSRVSVNGNVIENLDLQEVSPEAQLLRLPRSLFTMGETAKVVLQGTAPLTIGNYSPISLPLVFVASQPTESHVVAVELDDGINLSYCTLKNAQQVAFLPHNSLGRSNLQFRLFDSTAKIDLQLFRHQQKLNYTMVHKSTVNDLMIQSESVVRVAEGGDTTEQIELQLLPGWHTESVVQQGDTTDLRWEETTRDGQRILRIENASKSITFLITLRRTRENDFGNLKLEDFRPFDLLPGTGNEEWISVKPEPGFQLQLEPEVLIARKARADVPSDIDEMLGPQWKTPVFEIQGRSDLRHLLRVTRTRATYEANIDIQTHIREDSHQTMAEIRLEGNGVLPETLLVSSTQPWPADTTWTTPELEPVPWTKVTTGPVDETAQRDLSYFYELKPPSESTFPLILRGRFPVETGVFQSPLLLTVSSAETGTLTLIAPLHCEIAADPVLLRKVYLPSSTDQADSQVVQFEYRPIELRRLAESLDTLLNCKWHGTKPLPPIFASSAQHSVCIENNGQRRMTSTWQVVTRPATVASFTLPANATLTLVQWQGEPWSRWQERNGKIEVELPESATAVDLELQYAIDDGPVRLMQAVSPQFAVTEFPTSTHEYRYALGNRLQRVTLPNLPWNQFGEHLRRCLWTGIWQADLLAARSDEQKQDTELQRWSGESIWVVHQETLLVLSMVTLLASLVIGWCFFPTATRFLAAVLLTLVALAPWLPVTFAPISSAAFLGLAMGGIGGFLLLPAKEISKEYPTGSTIKSTRSTIATSSLLLAVTIGFLAESVSSLRAEEETIATKQTTYPVLIPIDKDRKPVGQAYLPQAFYEQLIASASRSDEEVPREIVEGMRYEISMLDGAPPTSEIAVTTHIELFATSTSLSAQNVRIPFDPKLGDSIETALHNDSILINAFNAETAELVIPIKESGPHSIKIQSTLSLSSEDEAPLELHLETPPNISTAVTLAESMRMGSPVIQFAGREVAVEASNIRQTIPLGPVSSFALKWSSPALQTTFEFQEYDLLEFLEDDVQLRMRLKLTNRPQQMGPILLSVDSRLTLNMQQSLDWSAEVKSSNVAASSRTYAINLLEGLTQDDEIELRFTLEEAQQVGQLRFPNIRVLNGTLIRRWVAVSATSQLQVQSQAQSRVSVLSQDEFLREWDEPAPDFRFAVSVATAEPLDWLISTRPIATRGNADLRYHIDLDADGYDFNIKAQIETYSGRPHQYVVEMMPDCNIESVQYLVDGLLRPIQWHYDSTSGELGVLLLSDITGLQELSIQGRKWLAADQSDLVLSPIKIREVHTENCRVQLSRDHSVLVRSSFSTNLIPIQEELNAPSDLTTVPVGHWQVADPSKAVGWQILPNQIVIRGNILTIVNREDGVWKMQWVGKLDIRSGSVGYLQWLVPPDITIDLDSVQDFEVTSWSLPDKSANVYQMIPRTAGPLSFDWRGRLEPTPGKGVSFSPLRLVGQPYISQLVAIPRQVDQQEVLWTLQDLRNTAVAGRWLTAHTPPTYQLLQATRPEYVCEIIQRTHPTGQPQVSSLETTIDVDSHGDVFGVLQATVIPQGNDHIEFALPPGVDILGASVDFERQWQLERPPSEMVVLPLKSNSLPQVVEIAFRSHLSPSGNPQYQDVPRPAFAFPTRTQERLRVSLPPNWQVGDLPETDQLAWRQNLVTTAFAMKDASRDTQTAISSSEIEHWNALRMEQAFTALKQYQDLLRTKGESPDETHRIITELLGSNTAEVEAWPVSGKTNSRLATNSLAVASEKSADQFSYFNRKNPSQPIQLHESIPLHGSPWPMIASSILAMAAIGLLFANLPFLNGLGRHVRDWMGRNPQICGILLGLFWWQFLPPHFIGLLLIAIVVWISIPWRTTSLFGRS
ncbi:hypothetical protein [Blastopirellula marina]|uniref:Uncharacterized protein n=1 Tax=Blastopirellula marina TaxID=124 RepID=A0A2S8FPX9_9BACT|nr:hypothetical protein [Blastopirellula marina]PQO33904.1 hypothetical protein C5Y98_16925 [Blastopirellula marina]PTL43691.1 hypothetical protein C5Y97_16935 [Blastopirellula marina]